MRFWEVLLETCRFSICAYIHIWKGLLGDVSWSFLCYNGRSMTLQQLIYIYICVYYGSCFMEIYEHDTSGMIIYIYMYYGHCFVAIYKDDTSGRFSLALCIMAVASWQYKRMTLLEDVCGPLYMKHRVGLGGAQSCRNFWKIHIGSILSQMYHMHAAWLKMKQFSEPLLADTQVWVGGVPSDLSERVFVGSAQSLWHHAWLDAVPTEPRPTKGDTHNVMNNPCCIYNICVNNRPSQSEHIMCSYSVWHEQTQSEHIICSDLVWSEHNLNIPVVQILLDLNTSYVQILFDLNMIWTYRMSKSCLAWTHHMSRSCLILTWSEHTICSNIVWLGHNLNTPCVQILFDLKTIWTHHVFRYCWIWTWSEHIMCSIAWSDHDLHTPCVQILVDLNKIWAHHVFICCLIWTQSEHTTCSDIVWSEHNLNTSCVQMLVDLNTIWTHHVFRYCLIWRQSEHIMCSDVVWSEHDLNTPCVQILFNLDTIWTYHMFMPCLVWSKLRAQTFS